MKKIFILCSAVSLLFMSCASQQCGNIPDVSDSQAEYTGPVYQSGKKKAQQSTFREIWAYLIDGREKNLSAEYGAHLLCFRNLRRRTAGQSSLGRPHRSAGGSARAGREHLVLSLALQLPGEAEPSGVLVLFGRISV